MLQVTGNTCRTMICKGTSQPNRGVPGSPGRLQERRLRPRGIPSFGLLPPPFNIARPAFRGGFKRFAGISGAEDVLFCLWVDQFSPLKIFIGSETASETHTACLAFQACRLISCFRSVLQRKQA